MLRGKLRTKSRRGAVAVEFAFVLPLLLIFILGIWEIGRAVQVFQVMSNAVREAARQAVGGEINLEETQQVVFDYLTLAGISIEDMEDPIVENKTDADRQDPSEGEQLDHYKITASLPIKNIRFSNSHLFFAEDANLTFSCEWFSLKDKPVVINPVMPTF